MRPHPSTRRVAPIAVSLMLASALCVRSGLAAADPPKRPPIADDDDQELKSYSPEMTVGGLFLGLGSTAAIVGGLTYATSTTPGQPVPHGALTVGYAVAGVGLAGLAAGLALMVVGAKKVPAHPAATAVPTVALGVRSASLTWSF